MCEGQTTRHEVQALSQLRPERGGDAMISVIVPGGTVSIPEDVFARLNEWARWARDRFGILDPHGRCRSIEGRHEAEYPDSERHVSMPLDTLAALTIEKIVAAPTFPRRQHLLLKLHFVACQKPLTITNACGIHRSHYGEELKRAVLMVRNNLLRKVLTSDSDGTRMRAHSATQTMKELS